MADTKQTANTIDFFIRVVLKRLLRSCLSAFIKCANVTECNECKMSLGLDARCHMPILVAVLSKAYVCSRSIAGIAGSNPVEDLDFRLLWK
jgi:hypothetical protein